jgi:periplasmic protein TonB
MRTGYGGGLIGSAALHAAAILALAGAATLPFGVETAPPAIAVSLEQAASAPVAEAAPAMPVVAAEPEKPVETPSPPPRPMPPAPVAPVVAVSEPPPKPVARPVEAKKLAPPKPHPVEVAALAPVAARSSSAGFPEATPGPAAISVDWQRELIAWLRANQHYPEAARRRNQTGQIQVSFVVARDGTVADVTILRSSGFDLLDDSARDMLAGAHVPAFPETMPQQSVAMSLPITFTLGRVP